ncbi:MFS transporter [Endothiovibrio diazotrophicus]
MSTAPSTRLVAFASILMLVSQLANYVLAPAFPQLPAEFGVSTAQVQRLIGVFLAGYALVQLVMGPLSDRFGRKPAVLLALVLFLVGTGVCAAAPTLDVLALGLLIQAMGAGSLPTLAQALLRDTHDFRQVIGVMSILSAVMAVTVAATPLIASYILSGMSWRVMFVGLVVLGLPLFAFIAVGLRETLDEAKRAPLNPAAVAHAYATTLRNRPFMAFALSLGLMTGAMAAFFAGSPFVFMDEFGWSYQQFGWWFLLAFSGFVIGSLSGGRLVAGLAWGMRFTALLGVGLATAGSALGWVLSQAMPDSAAAVLAGAFLFSLGLGIALGVGRGAAMLRVERNVGAASATINFLIGAIAAVVASLAPSFETHNHAGLFAVTALVAALAVIAVALAGPDPLPPAAAEGTTP